MYRFFVFVPAGHSYIFASDFIGEGGRWWELGTHDWAWFLDGLRKGHAGYNGFRWARYLDYSHLEKSDA